jgi:hypothetical protein
VQEHNQAFNTDSLQRGILLRKILRPAAKHSAGKPAPFCRLTWRYAFGGNVKCPSCGSEFESQQIKEKRQGLLSPTVKCPGCGAWLSKDKASSLLQSGGLVVFFVGLLGPQGYITLHPAVGYFVAVLGLVAFFLSFRLAKWQVSSGNA